MCKFKTFCSYVIIFLSGMFFSSLSWAEIKVQDDELFSKVLYLDSGKRLVLTMDMKKIILEEEQ